MIKESLAAEVCGLGKNASTRPQGGSMLLEAIIVLGMIATFTPLLYKHVADRKADIENINRANTLLYLQQKTEEYLKDPDNITDLVDELGHNQHKEIYPSELGIGDNFDGRYIIGIRREDEENKPVLKAMIVDLVNTGSDLRAAKVAEMIGVSAGIYTAVDPDAAWGINGLWSEPLERYFTTKNFTTGAVAVTTEYNKEKYRVNISDILVDSDLDLGEFDLTADQINAINLAAQKGTIGELIATTKVSSPKVVATEKLCVGGEDAENCIESWENLKGGGGGQDSSDLMLVQMCNSGLTEPCTLAFARDLNTSCSKVDAVYDRFGVAYPNPKIYTLTYGSGETYGGEIRVRCGGMNFVVKDISSLTLVDPVELVGNTPFGITPPGWYQIMLMGEAGVHSSGVTYDAAGGILIANKQFSGDEILTIKAIKGWMYNGSWWSGAGMALWDTMDTTGAPTLVAGGGAAGVMAGGGYVGGYSNWSSGAGNGYGWDGSRGGNTTYCDGTNNCDVATGGMAFYSSYTPYGGSGRCGDGYDCTAVAGGNSTSDTKGYPATTYGNWVTDDLTGGKGYASIVYCGSSQSDCPTTCSSDSDCSDATPVCKRALCQSLSCVSNSDCVDPNYPYCSNNACTNTLSFGTVMYTVNNISTSTLSSAVQEVGTYTIPVTGKYQVRLIGEGGWYKSNGYTWTAAGAGGILVANKQFLKDDILTIKGIKGNVCGTTTHAAGAGIALWDTIDTTGAPALVAGGGPTGCCGGGGYLGGTCSTNANWNGYSWDGSLGNNTTYCNRVSCNIGATGGSFRWSGKYDTYGGMGYCDNSYTCTTVSGGNALWDTLTIANYPANSYGNWGNNTLTGGKGYAAIVYCGPNADSTCPASCGKDVRCTIGSCNYFTGLCE